MTRPYANRTSEDLRRIVAEFSLSLKNLRHPSAIALIQLSISEARRELARRERVRPVPGSQQWAETYRDDLGESFD